VVKAVRYDEFGGIDVLRVDEVERPVPGDGQVLVRVKAAGINPSEAVIRTGAVAELFPSTFPSGQGSDLARVVEEVGAGVAGLSPGDEVIGFTNKRASQAELVLVDPGDLTLKPEKVSWEVAGGRYVAGVTAWGRYTLSGPKRARPSSSPEPLGGRLDRRPARAPYRGHGHRPGEREQPRVVEEPRRDPARVR
jgi:NADPH:quinone reductase-like Zn-dependent oxidoreductase